MNTKELAILCNKQRVDIMPSFRHLKFFDRQVQTVYVEAWSSLVEGGAYTPNRQTNLVIALYTCLYCFVGS